MIVDESVVSYTDTSSEYGVGIFVPLLAFNATVEAAIVGRFLGVRFADLWWPWFKANYYQNIEPRLHFATAMRVQQVMHEWRMKGGAQ